MSAASRFEQLEETAEKYAAAKTSRDPGRASLANKLIEMISSPDFVLPLKKKSLSSSGTTTYVYENDAGYPATFAFIAEVLHTKVPIHVGSSKFGPGEIIVAREQKEEAEGEIAKDVNELRELVHARKSETSTKHSAAETS